MSLFTKEDILSREIESWDRYGYALREENRVLFGEMLIKCQRSEYLGSVNAKGENFSAECLFLILILEQQKMIDQLIGKIETLERRKEGSSN